MGIYDRDWFGEERNWQNRRRRRRPQQEWWKKALIGAAIAVVGLSVLMAVRVWIVERAFDRAQQRVMDASSMLQQHVQTSTQRMLVEQQRQREARQALEQAKRQSIADAESARAKEYRSEIAERERKERAWTQYYKPPHQCDSANPNIDLVDCANRHIRAKREFEAKYAAGQI